MTLLERTRALKERCSRLETLQARIDETSRLDNRLSELNDRASALAKSRSIVSFLRSAGVSTETPSEGIGRNQARIVRLQARFATNRKAAALTQGRDWSQLIQELEELDLSIEVAAKASWARYVNALYAGETPNAIRGKLAQTDENNQAISQHEQAYTELLRAAASLPECGEDIVSAKRTAERLAAVTQTFNFNVPPTAKRFLEALARGGAPLETLTEEVRGWLAANNQTNRYRIVAVRS